MIMMMQGGSRNNSLTPSDVEVTRQFLATNKKVINRGDSFKKRQTPVFNKDKVEISIKGIEGDIILYKNVK